MFIVMMIDGNFVLSYGIIHTKGHAVNIIKNIIMSIIRKEVRNQNFLTFLACFECLEGKSMGMDFLTFCWPCISV